ncbi:hypothetical protein FKP32DRAFT_1562501, partial [Trametes sanguinea]
MKANAVVFEQPVLRVYDVLPPTRAELDECFAIVFTGTAKPTNDDYKRTPFLVRHRVVLDALRWLKLNHTMYYDVAISLDNLAQYNEYEPPVFVIYRHVAGRDDAEGDVPVYGTDEIDSDAQQAECSFMVHALTAPELGKMTYSQRLAYAIRYFDAGGRALGVGHVDEPQSMYHNQDLYPGMYPWLYPYGLGGFEN